MKKIAFQMTYAQTMTYVHSTLSDGLFVFLCTKTWKRKAGFIYSVPFIRGKNTHTLACSFLSLNMRLYVS